MFYDFTDSGHLLDSNRIFHTVYIGEGRGTPETFRQDIGSLDFRYRSWGYHLRDLYDGQRALPLKQVDGDRRLI